MCCNVLEESRSSVVVIGSDLKRLEPALPRRSAQPWPILVDQPGHAGAEGEQSGCGQHAQHTWRFRPQVTLIVQDEAARALDTYSGNFYALDAIGTRMLFATLETGSEAMVRTLAQDYDVAEAQVRSDWTELVNELHKAGLTETVRLQPKKCAAHGSGVLFREGEAPAEPRKQARREPRPPRSGHYPLGGFGVWVRLTLAWLSFWLLGWERTLKIWRRFQPRLTTTVDDSQPVVAEVDGLVRRMASRHPLNPQCKERALTSWHLLKRMGLPARLFMGVTLYPFTAHAWTECQGRIVGDERARCEQFVPVAVYQ